MTENLQIRYIFNPLRGDFKKEFYELIVLEQGSIIIDYGNGHLAIKAPACFIGQSEASLFYTPLEPIKLLQMRFSSRFLPNELLQMTEFSSLRKFKEQIYTGIISKNFKLCQKLSGQIIELQDEQGASILTKIYRTLLLFVQNSSSEIFPSNKIPASTNIPQTSIIIRVNKYIESHLSFRIKLSDLAKIAALTPTSFCRFYKQQTGISAIHYTQRLRIEKACRLLQGTDLSIKEIALQCGYEESSLFCNTFKKQIGWTPQTFRRQKKIE